MRFLTADYIFSAPTGFISKGILALDANGVVQDLIDPQKVDVLPDAEKFEGIICPGFINAHCHLELSHFRGKIPKHTGFVGFAKELMTKRNDAKHEEIVEAINVAEDEMLQNGIVAVGDISNSVDSFEEKAKGKLRYHTFIELLSLNPKMAEKVMEVGLFIKNDCPQTSSIVPHAPYTVSSELLEIIGNSAQKENFPLTIHNQESLAEGEFFMKGKGLVRELYEFLGIDISFFKPTGVNSLRSKLKYLPHDKNLILVHNTFTSAEDIRWAEYYSRNLYWCFCPNANLYIENTLPDFKLFLDANAKIVLGTDSLASNDKLSLLDEMKTIAKKSPEIKSSQFLTWATKNGADALGFSELGTFEKNKKPGVNLLSGMTTEKILPQTLVKKIT
ncbi:MAG: amidohydrolase family protein [Bacteroidetes bacterium]|nr:amidohydrolase family protein [Bacteroidota bacterium]